MKTFTVKVIYTDEKKVDHVELQECYEIESEEDLNELFSLFDYQEAA